jgi:hypothetical protein
MEGLRRKGCGQAGVPQVSGRAHQTVEAPWGVRMADTRRPPLSFSLRYLRPSVHSFYPQRALMHRLWSHDPAPEPAGDFMAGMEQLPRADHSCNGYNLLRACFAAEPPRLALQARCLARTPGGGGRASVMAVFRPAHGCPETASILLTAAWPSPLGLSFTHIASPIPPFPRQGGRGINLSMDRCGSHGPFPTLKRRPRVAFQFEIRDTNPEDQLHDLCLFAGGRATQLRCYAHRPARRPRPPSTLS